MVSSKSVVKSDHVVLPHQSVVKYLRSAGRTEMRLVKEVKKGTLVDGVAVKKDVLLMDPVLHRGDPFGVIVAVPVGDSEYAIGYSLVHPDDALESFVDASKGYNRKDALKLALGRANGKSRLLDMPWTVTEELPDFLARCEDYFSGCVAGQVKKSGQTAKITAPKRKLVAEQAYMMGKGVKECMEHPDRIAYRNEVLEKNACKCVGCGCR